MKKIIHIALSLLLIASIACAGQIEYWMSQLEHPQWDVDQLKPDNYAKSYAKYDFSPLLMPRHTFLGYIEPNYRRLRIEFASITKDKANQGVYWVDGFSDVNSNKCNFRGKMEVIQVREFENMHYEVDVFTNMQGYKAQGILIANYEFSEEKNQKFSGVFKGVMCLFWYLDHNGQIRYDDIEQDFSDRYRNNQYIGTWTPYSSNVPKIANWGEFRIPFSGDLDIGAGEFGVNPKYYDQGWRDLHWE